MRRKRNYDYEDSKILDIIHARESYSSYGFTWFHEPMEVDYEEWDAVCSKYMNVLGVRYGGSDGRDKLEIYAYAEEYSESLAIGLFRTTKLELFGELEFDLYGSSEVSDWYQLSEEGCPEIEDGDGLFYRFSSDEFPFSVESWHEDLEAARGMVDEWPEEPFAHITEDGYHVFDEPFIVPRAMWEENHPDCVILHDDVDSNTMKIFAYAEDDDDLTAFYAWNRSGIYPSVMRFVNGKYEMLKHVELIEA